jgi:hypothetical protein
MVPYSNVEILSLFSHHPARERVVRTVQTWAQMDLQSSGDASINAKECPI